MLLMHFTEQVSKISYELVCIGSGTGFGQLPHSAAVCSTVQPCEAQCSRVLHCADVSTGVALHCADVSTDMALHTATVCSGAALCTGAALCAGAALHTAALHTAAVCTAAVCTGPAQHSAAVCTVAAL